MSRSIRQTNTSVFRYKSKSEINDMTKPEKLDPDVIELRKKIRTKYDEIIARNQQASQIDKG